jgi:hypothetical protein
MAMKRMIKYLYGIFKVARSYAHIMLHKNPSRVADDKAIHREEVTRSLERGVHIHCISIPTTSYIEISYP